MTNIDRWIEIGRYAVNFHTMKMRFTSGFGTTHNIRVNDKSGNIEYFDHMVVHKRWIELGYALSGVQVELKSAYADFIFEKEVLLSQRGDIDER